MSKKVYRPLALPIIQKIWSCSAMIHTEIFAQLDDTYTGAAYDQPLNVFSDFGTSTVIATSFTILIKAFSLPLYMYTSEKSLSLKC